LNHESAKEREDREKKPFIVNFVNFRVFVIQTDEVKKQMSENKYEFNDNTSEIISAALEVHKAIGPGFLEVVYQRALFYEMKLRNIEFTREAELDIVYKGKKVGKKRVDFYVGDCLVEMKAKTALEDIDFMQTLSYLRASNKKIALLLNFGGRKLEIKRIVN